jgi:hypothetical protein
MMMMRLSSAFYVYRNNLLSDSIYYTCEAFSLPTNNFSKIKYIILQSDRKIELSH